MHRAAAKPTPSFWRKPESSAYRIGAQHRNYALRAGYDLDTSLRWYDGVGVRALLAREATG